MSIIQAYRKLDAFAHAVFSILFSKKYTRHYRMMYKENGIKLKKLTKQQKKEVRTCWGLKRFCVDYSTHELYYSVTGEFDPRVCSEMLYRVKIDPLLNERKVNYAWDDKNYFDCFFPDVKFPFTLVRNIYGSFLDREYQLLKKDDVKEIVSSNLPVIIKPSQESGLSKNVEIIEEKDDIDKMLDRFHTNYIVQRVVEQCDEFKLFSPRSVNIMRIITVIIDGKPQFMSASLRANTENAIADNRITADGRGMLVIGINRNGTLKETGIYSCGVQMHSLPNGVVFSGFNIPSFEKAVQMALKAHERMPMLRAVGWDITIDKNYEPLIIEYNLKGMGIYLYQLANGPLFGEYTQDIVKMLM